MSDWQRGMGEKGNEGEWWWPASLVAAHLPDDKIEVINWKPRYSEDALVHEYSYFLMGEFSDAISCCYEVWPIFYMYLVIENGRQATL